MYKEASRIKLRIITVNGSLTVDQLWTLKTDDLDTLAVSLEEEYKRSGKKSFLEKKSKKDKELKLKFDIVLDILNTKVEETEIAIIEASKNEDMQELLSEKVRREKEGVKELTDNELDAKIKKLR